LFSHTDRRQSNDASRKMGCSATSKLQPNTSPGILTVEFLTFNAALCFSFELLNAKFYLGFQTETCANAVEKAENDRRTIGKSNAQS
jgi:hypothetical protein